MRSLILKHQVPAITIFVAILSQVAAQQIETTPSPTGTDEPQPSVLVDEPRPELERPKVWGEPTEIQLGIYIIDVDEVNSADQSFAASFYFEAQWQNPLLKHEGPSPRLRNLTDVWNPRLTIISQQMSCRSYTDYVEIQQDPTVVYRQKL
jgi:hypothetical protein